MFSRSLTVLARGRPPFSTFYKSIAPTLAKTPAPQRMSVASALWRRTAPQYGIVYSAPRVAAAKQIYKKEGKSLVKNMKSSAQAARRSKAPKKVRKSPSKAKAAAAKKNAKRSSRKVGRKSAKSHVTPYASFTAKVLKGAKLKPSATTNKRIFRMWIMTGQQHSLSMSRRVSMAVRLLSKNKKSQRKLSKKLSKKTKKSAAKRAGAAKKKGPGRPRKAKAAKAAKKSKKVKKPTKSKKTASKKKSKSAPPKKRFMSKKKASAKRRRASATKSVARKAKSKSKSTAKTTRKAAKTSASQSKKRGAAAKRTSTPRSRHENPYIEFYRRMRMTGLLPNGRKVVGSRQIKALWARTHSLPTIDARVARATKLLEAQTGMTATPTLAQAAAAAPAAAHTSAASSAAAPATISVKDIKVPDYYQQNPFGATYAALLPALQGIPESTRMAHVAKAWSSTEQKDDHRSAKARIAAVANELKK